jgi:glycosyltransferase involved in cell wall biosynthesis
LGRRSIDYSKDNSIARRLGNIVDAYDLVVARHLSTAGKAGLIGRTGLVVDIDDFESQIYETRMMALPRGHWKRLILGWHVHQLKNIERELISRVSLAWVSKESDANLGDSALAATIPNIPFGLFDGSLQAMAEKLDSRIVLMVASFYHPPNRRGLARFLGTVWPSVAKAVPGARLRVVGAGMPLSLRQLCESSIGVEVAGFVEDLAAEYRWAALAVAPIYDGGGSNIKVLEALAVGRVCVSTEKGAHAHLDQLGALPALLVAKDAKEYAEIIASLLLDPDQRVALSAETGPRIEAACSFTSLRAAVVTSIAKLEKQRDDGQGVERA